MIFAFKIYHFSAHKRLNIADFITGNLQQFVACNQLIITIGIVFAELSNERSGNFITIDIGDLPGKFLKTLSESCADRRSAFYKKCFRSKGKVTDQHGRLLVTGKYKMRFRKPLSGKSDSLMQKEIFYIRIDRTRIRGEDGLGLFLANGIDQIIKFCYFESVHHDLQTVFASVLWTCPNTGETCEHRVRPKTLTVQGHEPASVVCGDLLDELL